MLSVCIVYLLAFNSALAIQL